MRMNNKENAGDLLCTDEERLLISRAAEYCVRGENSAVALSFLTPREQRLVYESTYRAGNGDRLFFWGGCVGAERRRAIFLPSWLSADGPSSGALYSEEREAFFLNLLSENGMTDILSEYVCPIKLRGSGYAALSHRDYLGALMALGLKRSVIGDICTDGNSAVVFCEEKTCDFIAAELKRAGRDTLKCERVQTDIDFRPVRNFREVSTTVASLRIDGVVRALCNVSREEAARLVTQGVVEVNYFVQKETDRAVSAGDIISVRGYGKYIIDRVDGLTRRARIRLLARKYM